jgi:hypothetical protein
MKTCPLCRRLVDERERRCGDCGYDWADPPPTTWQEVRIRFERSRFLEWLLPASAVIAVIVAAVALFVWSIPQSKQGKRPMR